MKCAVNGRNADKNINKQFIGKQGIKKRRQMTTVLRIIANNNKRQNNNSVSHWEIFSVNGIVSQLWAVITFYQFDSRKENENCEHDINECIFIPTCRTRLLFLISDNVPTIIALCSELVMIIYTWTSTKDLTLLWNVSSQRTDYNEIQSLELQ